jgi:hypothetical protein
MNARTVYEKSRRVSNPLDMTKADNAFLVEIACGAGLAKFLKNELNNDLVALFNYPMNKLERVLGVGKASCIKLEALKELTARWETRDIFNFPA